MNATSSARPFAARYPGSCLCGARFPAGAAIYWDAKTRRATLCPACAAPKAIKGSPFTLPKSGLTVRFDRHPTTNAVVLCAVTANDGAWNALEVYALVDGRWVPKACGGQPVLSRTATHAQIEAWRTLAEAALTA